MSRPPIAGLTIAAVSRETGIPITTLRFYEKELPGLLPVRKTPGGHRRYRAEDVARLAAVRRLTEEKSVKLADVRRIMTSRGDSEALRAELDRALEILRRQSEQLDELRHDLSRLAARVSQLETRPRRGWFK
jgi:DNA-binding transcriptional MerR regulator